MARLELTSLKSAQDFHLTRDGLILIRAWSARVPFDPEGPEMDCMPLPMPLRVPSEAGAVYVGGGRILATEGDQGGETSASSNHIYGHGRRYGYERSLLARSNNGGRRCGVENRVPRCYDQFQRGEREPWSCKSRIFLIACAIDSVRCVTQKRYLHDVMMVPRIG